MPLCFLVSSSLALRSHFSCRLERQAAPQELFPLLGLQVDGEGTMPWAQGTDRRLVGRRLRGKVWLLLGGARSR